MFDDLSRAPGPEVKTAANEYKPLKAAGCLINSDLGGLAFDATIGKCRDMVWTQYIKPRYYDQVHKHVAVRFIAH